jgi:hypothetical protein
VRKGLRAAVDLADPSDLLKEMDHKQPNWVFSREERIALSDNQINYRLRHARRNLKIGTIPILAFPRKGF